MSRFAYLSDAEFAAKEVLVTDYLLDPANTSRLNVSAGNQTELTSLSPSFRTTWTAYNNPATRTTTVTHTKTSQRNALQKLYSKIYDDIPHSALTQQDSDILGIPLERDEPTDSPVMNHPPIGELEKTGPFRYKLSFHEPDTPESRKMPDGQEFIMAMLYIAPEGAPGGETMMMMSQANTLKPLLNFYHTGRQYVEIVIPEQYKGRTGLLQWCYINTRGIASPMDPALDFLIS